MTLPVAGVIMGQVQDWVLVSLEVTWAQSLTIRALLDIGISLTAHVRTYELHISILPHFLLSKWINC